MVKAGTIDKAAYDALPPVNGTAVTPTVADTEKATAYLADNWAKAVG
jgi:putative spermidine/putrescine transport system substrate-binding protein